MKIKTLELEAFGPYLDKQVLDFSSLNEAELFLVTGDTGAGKTTIFDAISFALYGVPSGNTRLIAQFRNQKADANVETYVKLTFVVRGKEYIITRYPNYLREGYKTETRHRVYLEGVADYALEGVNEVALKVKEIIGVDANEFRQVAMIAQGQFTKLIQASSREREAILRELFSTHAYASFQERLKKAEREQKEVYQNEKMKMDTYLEALEDLNDEEPLDYLNVKMTQLKHLLVAQKQAQDIYRKDQANLATDLENALALASLYAQLQDLEKKNEILLSNAKEMATLQEEIALLKKVANISLEETTYKQASQQAKEVQHNYEMALRKKTDLARHRVEIENEAKIIKDLEVELQQHQKVLEKIDEDLERVEQYEKARNLAVMALKQKNVAQEKVDMSLLQKQELENILQRCESDLKDLAHLDAQKLELTHQSSQLDLEKQRLQRLEEAQKKVAKLEENLQIEKARWEEASQKQREISDEKLRMEKLYQAGLAGLLAQELKDNMPCPVCGSLHHPHKAADVSEGMTSEKLEEQQQRLTEIAQVVQASFGQLMGLKQVCDLEKKNFEEALDGQSFETIKAHYQEAYSTFEEKKQALLDDYKQQAKLNDYLKEYQERYVKWQDKHTELEALLQSTHENLLRRNEQFELLHQSFNEAFEGLDVLVRKKTQLGKMIRDLSTQLESYQQKAQQYSLDVMKNQGELDALTLEHQKNQQRLSKTQDAFERALQSGDLSMEVYQQLLLQLPSLEAKEKTYQDYRQQKALYQTQIEELSAKIENRQVPDIESMREAKKMVDEKLNEVSLALEKNKWQLDTLTKQQKDIQNALTSFKKAEVEYQKIYGLSRLVSGQNHLHITFESYILATYFEAILERANLRLTAMTYGRYALMRRGENQGGRAIQGLDLDVMDYESGKPRDIRTLSGGEAFKAALSLALGMADLISESVGGIELDTLFIDEGFGSLDDRSLETALDTLVELKQEHKVVGIISHVAALKERLTSKITVSHQKNTSVAKIS